jgi:hypothetical protein
MIYLSLENLIWVSEERRRGDLSGQVFYNN